MIHRSNRSEEAKPIWTAERLNQESSAAETMSLAFSPSGKVFRLPNSTGLCSDLADLIPVPVGIVQTVTENLKPLPPWLALCVLDPAPGCVIVIHPQGRQTVGPFRNVAAPLHEWLLRTAQSGSHIPFTRNEGTLTEESTNDAGFPLPNLVPEKAASVPNWLSEYLEGFDLRRLGQTVQSEADAVALSAGIWLMNDAMDRSHELSQSVEGRGRNRAGDYWHAILHRREPDYANAKYWLRHVGTHPIHADLTSYAGRILDTCRSPNLERFAATVTSRGWDAFGFVDLCAESEDGRDTELSLATRQIQLVEMTLLLASTYHDAVA